MSAKTEPLTPEEIAEALRLAPYAATDEQYALEINSEEVMLFARAILALEAENKELRHATEDAK